MLNNFVSQKKWFFLTMFISFGLFNPAWIFGQIRVEPVENINVVINSNNTVESNSKLYFDVPINKNAPILGGGDFRVEESETGDSWQIDLFAVAEKQNPSRALLKSTLTYTHRNKTKIIQRKITLKKGQTRIFYLNLENLIYQLTAFYQSENKKI